MSSKENKRALEKKEQEIFEDKVYSLMEGRVLSTREIAEEMDIEYPSAEYWRLSGVIGKFEHEGTEETPKLPLIRIALGKGKLNPHTFRYYRLEDEQELIDAGVIGAELKNVGSATSQELHKGRIIKWPWNAGMDDY